MADNFFKIHKGLNLTPRSTDPNNPIEGDLQWSDGTVRPAGLWAYKNGAWTVAGGSGGGGLDTFYTQDFEAYGVGDFTSGLNATYKTAGTFGGVLSSETTNPISKDSSPKYTAGVTSTNDWFDVEVIDLDLKQRGVDIGIVLWADMTNFSTDAELVIWDVTNSKKLDTTGLSVLKGGSGRSRYSIDSVFIPSNTTQISWGFHMVTSPVNGESFIFDDMELSTNPFVYKNIVEIEAFRATDSILYSSNNLAIPYFNTVQENTVSKFGTITNDSSDGFTFTATRRCSVVMTHRFSSSTASYVGISKNATAGELDTSIQSLPEDKVVAMDRTNEIGGAPISTTYGGVLEIGESIAAHLPTGETAHTSAREQGVTLLVSGETEHIITPARSNMSDWAAYTPIFTGFGTPTSVNIYWRRVGDTMQIRGRFQSGTSTATEAQLSFPNSETVKAGSLLSLAGFWVRDSNSNTHGGSVMITENDTFLNFSSNGVLGSDATPALTPQNGDLVASNGIVISIDATIPIEGWSSDATFLAAIPVQKVAYIKDVKAEGTSGGTNTSLTVHTRDLNTLEGDISFISLSANQITLQSGEYLLEAEVPARAVNKHQAFVHDGTSYVKDGSSTIADNPSGSLTISKIYYHFSITESTTYEIRHWTEDGLADGLGFAANLASNPSNNEIYTQVKVTKLR